jgi:hypothetical protein
VDGEGEEKMIDNVDGEAIVGEGGNTDKHETAGTRLGMEAGKRRRM